MPFINFHSARLRSPDDFDPNTFRNTSGGTIYARIKVPTTIEIIWAKLKGKAAPSDPVLPQALRFSKENWTVSEAKGWLEKNKIKYILFEPAKENKSQAASQMILLCEAAPVDFIEAQAGAENKLPTFEITAYTGAAMRLGGWGTPVVIDLEGMKSPNAQIPIFQNHDRNKIVGHGTPEITAQRVKVKGIISGTGDAAREVVENHKNGFPWKASVGAVPTKIEFVDAGATAKANGKVYSGPAVIVRASELGEISFVPMAADSGTSAKIAALRAANLEEDTDMEFEKWLIAKGIDIANLTEEKKAELQAEYDAEIKAKKTPDPPGEKIKAKAKEDVTKEAVAEVRAAASAETKRIVALEALFTGYKDKVEEKEFSKIQADAIDKGWDARDTELALLRAARPKAPSISVSQSEGGPQVLEAAMCLNMLAEEKVVKNYGAPVVEAARKRFHGPIGIQELILECAAAGGFRERTIKPGNIRQALEAAFSTQNAAGILSNVANKILLDSFLAVDSSWREIAAVGPVKDFKSVAHYRLTGDMEYEEVGPGGDIPHAKTNEETYSAQAKTYGKMFAITRQDIINDDLGAFNQIRSMLGRGAALALNTIFWTAFMNNGSFFTGARNNYFAGAATVLQSSSLATAEQMFLEMVDSDGKYLGASPAILLVPPALGVTARELFQSTNINTGGSSTTAKVPNANVFAGKYRPVVSPYLSNAAISGYSSVIWYLLANPADLATIKVVFLNGQETPTVDSAEVDFNKLGIQLRGYFDFGVTLADYYAGVKSKGAA